MKNVIIIILIISSFYSCKQDVNQRKIGDLQQQVVSLQFQNDSLKNSNEFLSLELIEMEVTLGSVNNDAEKLEVTDNFNEIFSNFELVGDAKLVASWHGGYSPKNDGVLSDQSKISIKPSQTTMSVYITSHQSKYRIFNEGDGEALEDIGMEIYEYDFDNDKNKELVVVYSTEYSIVEIFIYRNQNGFTEKVAHFHAQFKMVLDKNTVIIPIGFQGLGREYIYLKNSFYKLNWHDPKLETDQE